MIFRYKSPPQSRGSYESQRTLAAPSNPHQDERRVGMEGTLCPKWCYCGRPGRGAIHFWILAQGRWMLWLDRVARKGCGTSSKGVLPRCVDRPRLWGDVSRVGDPKFGRPRCRKVGKSSMAVKE